MVLPGTKQSERNYKTVHYTKTKPLPLHRYVIIELVDINPNPNIYAGQLSVFIVMLNIETCSSGSSVQQSTQHGEM